jgi:DNA polymerase I-like protein with 3'-5' exonuclease and polymerase domains
LQKPRKATKANGLDRDESNYTRLLNSPIQGLGADILKAALALLWEQHLCDQDDIKLVAVVHDEVILEAPESKAEYAKQILQECMEDAAPLVGVTKVPVVAEPSAGRNWGEV